MANDISASSNYTLTLSDYLTNDLGIEKVRKVIPFFLQIVDSNNNLQPLYFLDDDTEVLALRFDINPHTVSMNMAKTVNRTQTMTAWHEDHWGEELDTMSFAGSSAAFVMGGKTLYGVRKGGGIYQGIDEGGRIRRPFYESLGLVNPEVVTPPDDIGLTTTYRRNSVSYLKMKKILQTVHMNGLQFKTDNFGLVSDRNFIRIGHDYFNCDGYIESCDVSEDATVPFRYTYTIAFKSEKTTMNYLSSDL